MENEAKIIFNPDAELVEFAKDFSGKYKSIEEGFYASSNGNYNISYLDLIIDYKTLNVLNTTARISNIYQVIEINRLSLLNENYNSDYVFYIIIWLVAKHMYHKENKSDTYVDILVLNYYVTTGRSLKNMALGFIHSIKNHNSEYNHKRYLAIDKYIKEYQEKNK
jgi:hypothetical protein